MQIAQLPVTPNNILFISFVLLQRAGMKLLGNDHPSSAPYISGDGFYQLAQYHWPSSDPMAFTAVSTGSIVFVALPYLEEFFSQVHPLIPARYILVSHNGDNAIHAKMLSYLDDKIIHWFSQNVLVQHPKLTPIPIGIENYAYYNHGIPWVIRRAQSRRKTMRILSGFSISTNPAKRSVVAQILSENPLVDSIAVRLNAMQYAQVAATYGFVASPPGNGEDCIRTWEALYARTIPIVERSVLTEYFVSVGIPLWIIDDWKELEGYTAKQLATRYRRMWDNADTSPLRLSYWERCITAMYE